MKNGYLILLFLLVSGNICKAFEDCKFWSWVGMSYPDIGHQNECWLKTSDAGIELEVGMISGDKRCPN